MTPTDKFVEAMRWLRYEHMDTGHSDEIHGDCGAFQNIRQAVEAFADVLSVVHSSSQSNLTASEVIETQQIQRAALLKRVMEG